MLERLRTRFQAKAASYHVNAIHDAYLAQELLNFADHKDVDQPTDLRFQTFIDKSLRFGNKTLFLACCAYTLAEVNGRMDFVLAAFYARLTGFQENLKPDYFKTPSPQRFPFISSWLLPLIGNYDGVNKYLEVNGIKTTKEDLRSVLLPALRFVQETNIDHNMNTLSDLEIGNKTPKFKDINVFAQQSSDPDQFLDDAARTQGNAIFWDRLYIKLIDIASNPRKK